MRNARRDAGLLEQELNGRNYSPRMGVISLNGAEISSSLTSEVKTVNVGDEIVFLISDSEIPEDFIVEIKTKEAWMLKI